MAASKIPLAAIAGLLILLLINFTGAIVDPFKDDLTKFDLRERFQSHPMLYFTSEYIPIYRRKAETTHKHIMQEIIEAKNYMLKHKSQFLPSKVYKEFAKDWNEMYGNNIPVLATYSMLYPDDKEVFEFILQYMDNMVDVGNWQVIGQEADEVPINHQLAGFSTAFDFLYSRFDDKRREKYANKIVNMTEQMYELSLTRWWGRAYIQNHVATNTVGLLIGSLISRLHCGAEKANVWIKRALAHYERTMWLFNKVGDGTSNEGVAYGGYTARSLTEYVFFAGRHFNNNEHLNNQWMKEHFWFYYATVLPGFQFSVGIADSAPNWWYGPESQLVFLDNYIMKNGSGNWLAEQIDKHRGELAPGFGQRWTTLHTEFIWYNASLKPKPPRDHGNNRVHLFPDWGVATYGFAVEKVKNNSFLSFKSSYTHGKTIFNYVQQGAKFLDGWNNFNAGHEHPDKNSFTFAPNGELFVTEGLYGTKFTFLDNVVMFAPYEVPFQCTPPWVGQLGSCAKWLSLVRDPKEEGASKAEMIASEQRDGFVHFSGDGAQAYPKKIGIEIWYRNLVLLNPQLLLLHDYVQVSEKSNVSRVSAYFNNFLHNYYPYKQGRFNGFQMNLTDGNYKCIYTTYGGQKPFPTLATLKAKRYISNANVTYNMERKKTDMAYLFFGPNIEVFNFRFFQYLEGAVRLQVITSTVVYDVRLLSNYKNDSLARHYMDGQTFHVAVRAATPDDFKLPIRPPNPINEAELDVRMAAAKALGNAVTETENLNDCIFHCVFYSTFIVFAAYIIVLIIATNTFMKRRRSDVLAGAFLFSCMLFIGATFLAVSSCKANRCT